MSAQELGNLVRALFCPPILFISPLICIFVIYEIAKEKVNGTLAVPIGSIIFFFALNLLGWLISFDYCINKLGWFKRKEK